MNKFKKVVFLVTVIFPILSLGACNPSKKEAVDKIESYLEKKYNEPFEVTGIGGGYGTRTTNTLKANVQPKDNPDLKFRVEVTKDLKEIWDSYMNALMAKKINDEALELAKPIFPMEVWAKTYMSSPGLSFPDRKLNEKSISVKDYLDQYPDNGINIFIYLKSACNISPSIEAGNIDKMADQMVTQGYKSVNVIINYLKPDSFKELNDKYKGFKNSTEGFEYFTQKEKSVAHSFISIENGQKKESTEKIQNKLSDNSK